MRALLQRVESAEVRVGDKTAGKIGAGLLIFLGVGKNDTEQNAEAMVEKITRLRIFSDAEGKTNLSVSDVGGEALVVSQFTLYADCKKGNRPSFTEAGDPERAERLYDYFILKCGGAFKKTESGIFGASMKVELINDGPFTVMLEN